MITMQPPSSIALIMLEGGLRQRKREQICTAV